MSPLFCVPAPSTEVIGEADVPPCSQLHVTAEVMGWAEAGASGCLTAQHLCPVLPCTAPACVRPCRNLTPVSLARRFLEIELFVLKEINCY